MRIDSRMLVEERLSDDPTVQGVASRMRRATAPIRRRIDNYPVRLYRHRRPAYFSPALAPSGIVGRVREAGADIVHLHWVGGSFVRPEDVPKFKTPVVWTLRDMWPFTGGCFYTTDCAAYEQRCGACPSLGSGRTHDLAWLTWMRKERAWRDAAITPVGISEWMSDRARACSLPRPTDPHHQQRGRRRHLAADRPATGPRSPGDPQPGSCRPLHRARAG